MAGPSSRNGSSRGGRNGNQSGRSSAGGRGATGGGNYNKSQSASAASTASNNTAPDPIYSEDGLILSTSDSGSTNLARVHRAQWNDYLKRFAPVENMLFDRLNDTEHKPQAVNKAGLTMASAFDKSQDQLDRSMSRYGLNMTPAQTQRQDKEFALEKTAAVAGAKNGMRIAKDDQETGIVAGGLSTLATQRA
ncbi:hypothetical protein A3765_28535 [Oleiphilus sp. HI0130]|nr:hypothetical protein A3765_28535 [Oleiphilus sp. HI0130]